MSTAEETGTPARLEGKGIAVLICWILGMGSLLAWNTTLTVGDYYYKVFPNYHPSRVLTLVYQPLAVGTLSIFTYNESRVNTRRRIIAGYLLYFIGTLGCILACTKSSIQTLFSHLPFVGALSGVGGVGPYVGLCIMVGSFGVGDALVQGGMCGDLALMLPEFVLSYFAGLAASGALTSGLRLVTKAVFEKSPGGLRKGALLFLAISTGIEFLCIFLYAFYFPKLPIVKHFRAKAASEGSKTVIADLAAAGISQVEDGAKVAKHLTLRQLIRQNWDYLFDLYLTYVVTLSIFPGFLYENTGEHTLGSWYAIVLIAMFNVFDLIGRYAPLIKWLKLDSRKSLMTAVLARLLFVPAFYFTAKYAGEGWMIMLVSVLGLTNGHLTTCVMTVAPKGYMGPEQNALGNLLVLFLVSGIFSGVCLDWLWIIGNGSF